MWPGWPHHHQQRALHRCAVCPVARRPRLLALAQSSDMEDDDPMLGSCPLTELGVGAALRCELEHADGAEAYLHCTEGVVIGHIRRCHPQLLVPGGPELRASFPFIAETLDGAPPLLMSQSADADAPSVEGGATPVPLALRRRGFACPSCGYVAVRKAIVTKHIKESAGHCTSNSKPEPCTLLLPGRRSQPRRIILTPPPPPRRASTAARVASAVAPESPDRSQARPQPADAESPPRRGREPLPRATQPASLCESA